MKGEIIVFEHKRKPLDSGEGPSTREGTNIRDFEKHRAEEYEQRQRDWKEQRERLNKFNRIMAKDDSKTILAKYMEIHEHVVGKYQLKELYINNENNTSPEDINAFKEINDIFENHLKALEITQVKALEITQELSKIEPVEVGPSLATKARDMISKFPKEHRHQRMNKEIGQLKECVGGMLGNIDDFPSEELKEKVLQVTLDKIKNFQELVPQSVEKYGERKGKEGRDQAEQRIKAINNQLKDLSEAVSIYKQVHEIQTTFIEDLRDLDKRDVETVGNAFKETLDSYKRGNDTQDLLLLLQQKHELLKYEVLKVEWNKQYDLSQKILMRSEAIDSDEMKEKRELCKENIKEWHKQRYLDKDLYPQDPHPHFDKGDPHTIAEGVHSMKEWNKKFEDDVFSGTVRKIEEKLSDPLLGLSKKENLKVVKSIEYASERYKNHEGRADRNLAEQGIEIIDQLNRLDKNLESQKDIHNQCKQLYPAFQGIRDKMKSITLPEELTQDFNTTLTSLSEQYYQLAKDNFTSNFAEKTLMMHQKKINKLNLEAARELDRLLQQAHRQEQDNPDARVVYKQAIRNLQEVKDPIDLINIKEQLAERYNSVLKYLKEIDVSKENKNIREDIQNFKGCVEYFEKNIKTFLDEKKFYTACKLSEELAYRIKMAKSIDDNVFINIDNRLKDIEFRHNDYSREISESATLEKKKPNEDTNFSDEEYQVYAVFDGVTGKPGGSGGHLASAIAVDYLRQSLTRLSDDLHVEDMKKNMKDILFGIHNEIIHHQKGNYSEMATTASIVKIMKDGTAVIGNAGDSRVYLLRSGKSSVEQLTLDHAGWVEEVENMGCDPWNVQKAMAEAKNPKEPSDQIPSIATEPEYLGITQCLGKQYNEDQPESKLKTCRLKPRDVLLITSDGVHDNLTDQGIAKHLLKNKSDTKKAVDALVREAKHISGQKTPRSKIDDITAVVYVHGKGRRDVEKIESERLEKGR